MRFFLLLKIYMTKFFPIGVKRKSLIWLVVVF